MDNQLDPTLIYLFGGNSTQVNMVRGGNSMFILILKMYVCEKVPTHGEDMVDSIFWAENIFDELLAFCFSPIRVKENFRFFQLIGGGTFEDKREAQG